jgi:hypothetical protein
MFHDDSPFATIFGVDFSGAKLAGRTTWVARIEPEAGKRPRVAHVLAGLARLENVCGTAERCEALSHLVGMIGESRHALWALDFPFGLPVEVLGGRAGWAAQFDLLREWDHDGYGLGVECLRRARALGGPMHIRRLTDCETKAPFDPYHYRIIYQTFHGMRDVLGPLRRRPGTAILPFQYRRLPAAQRVLVEACPASTLKRLGLPHQNYKQPAGGALVPKRLRTRRVILDGLARHVRVSAGQRRVMMRDGGGDALDAVIAAVGGALAWAACDHAAVARHPRYPREGRLFA